MDFHGKSIIITGASTGIGRELAVELARRGGRLAIVARGKEGVDDAAHECREVGGEAIGVAADVGEQEQCKRAVDAAVEAYGGVDILINNAGISMWGRFDELKDLSIVERIMKINYLGSVYCTHYALPHLKASKGLIVAVSSLTGLFGVPTRSAYAASKHAMQGFFDSLRVELRGTGVDVLVVSPGFVATDIRAHALGNDGTPLGESPRNEETGTMSVEECILLIVRAMERRQRELVMTAKGRLGRWLVLLAPDMVDRLAIKALRERNKTG